MARNWTMVTTLAMLLAFGNAALAADDQAKQDKAPAEAQATKAADQPTVAQLRARLHHTMAALVDARAAENPDPERIDQLAQRARSLRRQILALNPEADLDAICPWGGPGLGRGPGWGGRGAGYGWGRGYGPDGYGRGPGYGPPGWGMERGYPGRGFIDLDGDGVCDRYERRLDY